MANTTITLPFYLMSQQYYAQQYFYGCGNHLFSFRVEITHCFLVNFIHAQCKVEFFLHAFLNFAHFSMSIMLINLDFLKKKNF